MRKYILAAAFIAGTAATPALAQTATADAPFTGFRIEGIVGGDRPQVQNVGHRDGIVYGVGLGYDMQMGSSVVGIEAEATDSSADRCAHDVDVSGDRLCVGPKRDLYVGGRFGGAIGAGTLLYAKAGYSNARFGYDYNDGGNGSADFGDGRNLNGVRVGGGIEHKLGANSFLKAEYRYSNYENNVERHQVVGGFGVRF
jgi:outer membrane immunogenic protein